MQVLVITNNVGIMIDADVNVKNLLTKEDVIYLDNLKWFIWNPSICEFECNKSCDISQYSDYQNCKCRKRLVDKFVEECSENIDENEIIYNATLNDHIKLCHSCTIYIILLAIFFIISISIIRAFIYLHWNLKKDNTYVNTSIKTEISIY